MQELSVLESLLFTWIDVMKTDGYEYWIRLKHEKVRMSERRSILGARPARVPRLSRSVGISVGLFLRKLACVGSRSTRRKVIEVLCLSLDRTKPGKTRQGM